MPVDLREENEGRILLVRVSGKLTQEDYEQFAPEVDRLVYKYGKISILFEMHNFHGWDAGALWEDTKFAWHHFRDIERLAVVGEKRWQKGMTEFCQPFTMAEVRYFETGQAVEAHAWLQGVTAQT